MTWAMGTKLTIFSIAFMMIFAVVPPSFADQTVVFEDEISPSTDIDEVKFFVANPDASSSLRIEYECANSSDPATTLDPIMTVIDPDGNLSGNDDGLVLGKICGGFRGSLLVFDNPLEGEYTAVLRSFAGGTSGPYTFTLILTGPGGIFDPDDVAFTPPVDPPNDAPKGKKEIVLTPKGPCDALKNPGKGQGKDRAAQNNCAPIAVDDVFEFIDFITFVNILDNDLNHKKGTSSGIFVVGISDVVNNLPPGSLFFVSADGTFGVLCEPGVGTLTYTYTIENDFGLSDSATVTATCID